jgi:PKD repeat protein
MPKNPCLRSPSLVVLCLGMAAVLTFSPSLAFAKGCIESLSSQPKQAPAELWGNAFQPVGDPLMDSTNYNGNQRADHNFPQATSVDIENGYLFASYWAGFGIWDLHGDPEHPVRQGELQDGWFGAFPQWILGQSETDQYIYALDAPEGDDSLLAVAGIAPLGLSIWDTRNKSAPVALYQDAVGKEVQQVFAATIGGHAYAFAAGSGSGEAGLFIYDMTEARNRNYNKCVENVSGGQRNCPGVYVGKISTSSVQVQYVHGAQIGSRYYIAISAGLSSAGHFVKIYDVTNPAAPTQVVTGFTGTGLPNFTAGVALWQQNGSTYLAVRTESTLQTFDVTNCLNGGCASLPGPISTIGVAPVPESDNWKSVVFSRSGSKPMLFLGNHDLCHTGEGPTHTEYVFDMSSAANPTEVSPTPTTTYPASTPNETVNYWSYYYSDDVKGFAFTAPRGAKFYVAPNGNSYLYRADLTLLDIHKWLGGGSAPPLANFTWSPSTVFTGDSVTFSDTSQGTVTLRSWQFPGGSPSTSSASSQVVTFAAPGTKTVTLTASNTAGPNTVSKDVLVLNPAPAVANVTFTPANPLVCQPVTFTANGATGKPTLTFAWNVTDNVPSSVGTGTTNPFTWTTVGRAPGSYTATVTVHNGLGPDATASAVVTLGALGTLGFTGPPTNDPFTAGVVTFHAHGTAATEWNWDFGDGQGYRGWTGTYAVADPKLTYTTTGQKTVRVKIRNCVTAELESAALTVTVSQIAPLVAAFQAECPFGLCGFSTNQAITFDDQSSGSPDGYFYDWNHNSLAVGTCNPSGDGSVQTTHAYAAAGTFFPCLKVTRGAESQVYVHPQVTVSTGGGGGGGGGGGQTPSITINGPTSGAPNQALSFAAAASNCTPSATWTWNPAGGTFSGSSTGNQVSITWPGNGSHTVSVTNAGCGATGTISVTISDGGGGGGGGNNGNLVAAFTFSPASPNAGQAVSFDGSASAGSPTVYSWDFGDGQTASGGNATSSHTYQNGGTYTVKLEVGKQGAGCSFGVCSASITKTVAVGAGGPTLVASFDTGAQCISDFAGIRCAADVGSAVSFTATTANATSYSWSFGDGGTASGVVATHTWTQPGTFSVQLTVSDGRTSASTTRTFIVTGQAVVTKAVILPWIAQTRGALVQTSDLYLLNPTTAAMDVSLVFLRRGNTPETNPPKATRTIQPGATLYVADVLRQMFNREDVAGFVTVNVDKGTVEPVITAFNTTVQSDGKTFGQTVPGLSMSTTGSAASAGSAQVQNLIGLADNSDLLASFGVSNPGQDTLSYTLRLFDKLGQQIGTPHDFVVSRFGQRQFLPKEIQTLFGVSNRDDYRVEVRNNSGHLFPFSANLRAGSNDPSFVGAGAAAAQKVHLIGTLSSTDANKHRWQSDVVISNISTDVVLTDVSYIGTGVTAKPTAPLHLTLQPGETRRLSDVIGQQWGLRSTVGVITLDSDAPGGVFPIVQGESYDATSPTKRFGQLMAAVGESQAAGANASQYLVGLRQDAKNRSVLWIFNPGATACVYDVVYRGLDGHELGRIPGVAMGPGIVRQFGPAQHRLPAGGVANGFTVEVQVKSGKALAAAQVVSGASNDPAYIQGATR